MAGFLGLGANKKKRTPEEARQEVARGLFIGANPTLRDKYKIDPRTRLGANLMQEGSSTAPVAGGWAEGLARVGQGALGGIINKQQEGKYADIASAMADYEELAEDRKKGLSNPPPLQNTPPLAIPPIGPSPTPINTVAGALNQPVAGPQTAPVPAPVPPAPTAMPPPIAPIAPATLPTAPPRRAVAPNPTVAPPTMGGARANTGFQSFKSSAYDPLEDKYAAQFGVPVKMLRAIRLAGEQSNADQVSSVGARSVYQFTPGTRRLWMKNKGYDPWESPENAVRAAAEHLADDWRSTKGDPLKTVRRYHGGPDESKWGRANKRYGERVMAAMGGPETPFWLPGEEGAAPVEGAVGSGEVPVAPQIDVPELPEEMPTPARPELGERIRSARLEMLDSLMGTESPGLSGEMRGMIQDKYREKGYDTEEQIRAQREADRVKLIGDEFSTQNQLYTDVEGARRKAPIAERELAIRQNYGMEDKRYAAEIAADAASTQNKFLSDEKALDRDNKIALAAARAAAFKPPAAISKKYYDNVGRINEGGTVLQDVDKYPEGFGLKNYQGQALSQRTDPEGVKARASVAKYAGYLLHGISGAAVSPTEYARNINWLPAPTDTPEAIKIKMANIMNTAQQEIEAAQGIYGSNAYGLSGGIVGQQQQGPVKGGYSGSSSGWNE